jgi:hypothetical protein
MTLRPKFFDHKRLAHPGTTLKYPHGPTPRCGVAVVRNVHGFNPSMVPDSSSNIKLAAYRAYTPPKLFPYSVKCVNVGFASTTAFNSSTILVAPACTPSNEFNGALHVTLCTKTLGSRINLDSIAHKSSGVPAKP